MIMNKYPPAAAPSPESILSRHYITHSNNRLTSIHEFNADGEYMVRLKELYYDAMAVRYSDQDKAECMLIMLFMQSENKRLRIKHWGGPLHE